MTKVYPKQFTDIKRDLAEDHDLYTNLKQGTAVLKTENELNQYLYSYGNMHQAKLKETFNTGHGSQSS